VTSSLYIIGKASHARALSEDGYPELGTALKVMHAVGVELSASVVG
jgi:DNA-binding phage protein